MENLIIFDDRALVKHHSPETVTKSGLYLPSGSEKATKRATIIALSDPERMTESIAYKYPSLAVGDTVLISEYAGVELTIGEEKYHLVRIQDIMGKLIDNK